MPQMQMLRVEALERNIPGFLFLLGCISSRLGSFWFTFFFFYVSGEGSLGWWENVGKEWD